VPEPVVVLGVPGDRLERADPRGLAALERAEVVAGGRRLLAAYATYVDGGANARAATATGEGTESLDDARAALERTSPELVEIGAAPADAATRVAEAAGRGRRVVVLASGDPGFFGILRSLRRVLERRALVVYPAVSSIATAFARLGLPWDDAVVVSAHGRPLGDALEHVRFARKAAVITSPEHPPAAVGRALLAQGLSADLVAVASRLDCADEQVIETDLEGLAAGDFDPLSVVVLVGPAGRPLVGFEPAGGVSRVPLTGFEPGGGASASAEAPARASEGVPRYPTAEQEGDRSAAASTTIPEHAARLVFGLDEGAYLHRGGMITKSEVRAAVLAKLELPATGVLWDVGAGSGSVAIECGALCPGLAIFAIERDPAGVAQVAANARRHGVRVHFVDRAAPEAFETLPDPDRVFVGGGGVAVLKAALARLRSGGRLVASFASLEHAAEAASVLGSLAQLSVARGCRLPDGTFRLESENPVFLAWGP
jgi:precorrin-6Y C5,15-methyltransferase (decarboxylating)